MLYSDLDSGDLAYAGYDDDDYPRSGARDVYERFDAHYPDAYWDDDPDGYADYQEHSREIEKEER